MADGGWRMEEEDPPRLALPPAPSVARHRSSVIGHPPSRFRHQRGGSVTQGDRPRVLFVTGRLAEFALRQVLDELAPAAGIAAEVAVLPISVAALMSPRWVARHLEVPPGVDRVILPGHCRGDLAAV